MLKIPRIPFPLASGHMAFLGVILILIVGYAPSIAAITEEWLGNGSYSHGFLGLAIAVYLVWQKQQILRYIPEKHSVLALIATIVAGFAWFLAGMINVQSVELVSLMVILVSSMLFIFGWNTCLHLRIAMLTLLLVMPFWNFLKSPLQELSSQITYSGLRLLDIPILREGFLFSVPGGRFVIEEACSGLGFFLTSCLLSILYIHYNHVIGSKRYFFILFAIALSLVSNWIRILTVMVVGNYTRMEHIIVQDHLTFGWILFSFMLIPFFVVGHFITDSDGTSIDESTIAGNEDMVSSSHTQAISIIVIVLLVFPFSSWLYGTSGTDAKTSRWIQQEVAVIMKPSSRQQNINWTPHFIGASDQFLGRYIYHDQEILCLIVQYDRQEQGEELIYVENAIYMKNRWHLLDEKVVTTNIKDTPTSHRLLHLEKPFGPTRNLLYWYIIGGRVTSSPVMAKVYELVGILTGDRSAYLVALANDSFDNDSAEDRKLLIEISNLLQLRLTKIDPFK